MHSTRCYVSSSSLLPDNASPILPPKLLHHGGIALYIHGIVRHANRRECIYIHVCACVELPDLSTQPHYLL